MGARDRPIGRVRLAGCGHLRDGAGLSPSQERDGTGVSVNITPLVALARIGDMIPGQRESGSLTRFASSPQMPDSMVDVTLNAATIADRQREGGGAARERRPSRVRRWTTLVERVRSLWRDRGTPPPLAATR